MGKGADPRYNAFRDGDKGKFGTVTSAHIAQGGVYAENIQTGAVTTAKLADLAVTADKITDGAVGQDAILDGSVVPSKLDSGSVYDVQGLTNTTGALTLTGYAGVTLSGTLTGGTIGGHLQAVKAITAAVTLTAADSGKLFTVVQGGAADYTVTLPATTTSPGWYGRFVVKTTSGFKVAITADDELISGLIVCAGGAPLACALATTVNFAATVADIGDYINLYCDGAAWYIEAQGFTAASVTIG